MIHQIFMSGHVKKDGRKVVTADDARLMCSLTAAQSVKGITLFADGTFVCALEGEEKSILECFNAIKHHKNFAQTDIIMKLSPTKAEFKDYKIGLFGHDFSRLVPQSFRLTSESMKRVLPEGISDDLRVLFKTFARINNLEIRSSRAA